MKQKPGNSGSGGFYKYMPNLHGEALGFKFYLCVFLPPWCPQGLVFPCAYRGCCLYGGEQGRMGLSLCFLRTVLILSWGSSEHMEDRGLQNSAPTWGSSPLHDLTFLIHEMGTVYSLSTQSCHEDSMKCSTDVSSFIEGVAR